MSDIEKRPEQDDPEGHDPNEDAGLEECGATFEQVEHKPGELDDAAPPIRFSEQLQESYQPETLALIASPTDGMPVPVDTPMHEAPNLSYEHVCHEDDRRYVEVFADEAVDGRTVRGRAFSRAAIVARPAHDERGFEFSRREFDTSRVEQRWGFSVVRVAESDGNFDGSFIVVRPIRPRCAHYRRQVALLEGYEHDDKGVKAQVYRNCMARRSVGGAYLSVSDALIYACEHRDPPDPSSVRQHLDIPDARRMRRLPIVPAGTWEPVK